MNLIKNTDIKIICKTVEICNCPIHDGDTLIQVDGELPSGKQVRIMLDRFGYHVAWGTKHQIERAAPPGVTEAEARQILAGLV